MTFLTPLAFILLALIPPIIALYLLKLRRQDYEVSSTYLWQRFVRDVEANAPWQRLRRNLLLLLQILFLLLLIFALVRPATQADGLAGQSVVLILDNSASMAALDGAARFGRPQSRLAEAKAQARQLATNLPDDARVTVIAAAGGEASLLTSASQDRRQVLQAIDSLAPAALGSDLTPAVTLAEAVTAREPNAEIVLLTDGAVQLPDTLPPLRLIPTGRADGNQAISALSLSPTGNDDQAGALFVQVSNYAPQPAQRRLIIEADGTTFAVFDLDLPPASHVEQLIEPFPLNAQTVEAGLAAAENDILPLDDRAWLVVEPTEPAQAVLVTEGNFFLQTALNLLNGQQPGVAINAVTVAPTDWPTATVETLPQDAPAIHIFDRYTPPTLPDGNLLFIAPPQSMPGLFQVAGRSAAPAPEVTQADHPLIQNVALAETQILTTTVLSGARWARSVAVDQSRADTPPLLLAGEHRGRRVAVLAFDLHHSDLPLRPAFPILMANLAGYLAPGSGGIIPAQVTPGEAFSFSVPSGIDQVRLTGPDGLTQPFEPDQGRINLPGLTRLGLYRLQFEGSPAGDDAPADIDFAVNFFNPLESNVAPRPELQATREARPVAPAADLSPAYREWWRPLALAALALLLVEWLVYHRSRVFRWWRMVS